MEDDIGYGGGTTTPRQEGTPRGSGGSYYHHHHTELDERTVIPRTLTSNLIDAALGDSPYLQNGARNDDQWTNGTSSSTTAVPMSPLRSTEKAKSTSSKRAEWMQRQLKHRAGTLAQLEALLNAHDDDDDHEVDLDSIAHIDKDLIPKISQLRGDREELLRMCADAVTELGRRDEQNRALEEANQVQDRLITQLQQQMDQLRQQMDQLLLSKQQKKIDEDDYDDEESEEEEDEEDDHRLRRGSRSSKRSSRSRRGGRTTNGSSKRTYTTLSNGNGNSHRRRSSSPSSSSFFSPSSLSSGDESTASRHQHQQRRGVYKEKAEHRRSGRRRYYHEEEDEEEETVAHLSSRCSDLELGRKLLCVKLAATTERLNNVQLQNKALLNAMYACSAHNAEVKSILARITRHPHTQ